MLQNQVVKNRKPQDLASTKSQGKQVFHEDRDDPTILAESKAREELNGSKSRYEKGLELYKEGKVSIIGDGLFKVSGFYKVDTGKMQCECPDYNNNHRPCKHLFACLLFTKNKGKQRLEQLEGFNGIGQPVGKSNREEIVSRVRQSLGNGKDIASHVTQSHSNGAKSEAKEKPSNNVTLNKPKEAHNKDFDRQSTITRLAVINSAIELLKTHRKPIELSEVLSLASQFETWALGK